MYIVLFEDEVSAAAHRQMNMRNHLTFLARNKALIKAAGPLADPRSGLPAGGLWMVDSDDEDIVWQLIKEDPFWPTGLRKAVTVRRWNRVFADGYVSGAS